MSRTSPDAPTYSRTAGIRVSQLWETTLVRVFRSDKEEFDAFQAAAWATFRQRIAQPELFHRLMDLAQEHPEFFVRKVA